jgi:hypothetical protein
VPTLTQIRVCHRDACSEPVPAGLAKHRVCLRHYLDDAFTRVSSALQRCRQSQPLDSQTLDWLVAQGDFTVKLLSKAGTQSSEQRTRLLELLLCLANVQEHLRQRPASKA